MGLAAKNAILIVEFAKLGRESGLGPVESAMEAAKLRLRPILMTSFAFILGVVPLVIATGAGAASRNTMGTAVLSGMLAATLLAVFFVPVLFVVIQGLAERLKRARKGLAAEGGRQSVSERVRASRHRNPALSRSAQGQ
jgi:HAE1 family hydrophobic/amphiphilic exporter-1/multidrug efflux pump